MLYNSKWEQLIIDDKNLNITYSKHNDNGTKYDYYVKATNGNAADDIIFLSISSLQLVE